VGLSDQVKDRSARTKPRDEKARILLIAAMMLGITSLVYLTKQDKVNYQIFFRELYFVPIVLSGFWFGLRGALITSLSITGLYLPYTMINWRGFSASDIHKLMELLLYNGVALILGILKQRERAEQKRLREAENLAAMGKALSAVAHDMKTPLIAIGGFARLVKKHTGAENPYRDKLDIVVQETARMENMVKEMLDFSRPLALHPSDENVHRLVEESVAVVEHLARSRNVAIQIDSSPSLPAITIDAMRMKQVLINLVTNAVQASPEGNSISIRAAIQNSGLVIEVVDHGAGIPPEKKDEIFHPFVTTKKEGTGLGLSITRKIVEAHQGRIDVEETLGGGATFKVVMPQREHRPRKKEPELSE
jgi:two-component system, NtrC family, sensor histidine kinase HydH